MHQDLVNFKYYIIVIYSLERTPRNGTVMKWALTICFAGLLVFGATELEVFDLGDLEQYKSRLVHDNISTRSLASSLLKIARHAIIDRCFYLDVWVRK
jgi:hypothetical protein